MANLSNIHLVKEGYLKIQLIISKLNKISNAYGLSFEQFLILQQIIEEKKDSPKDLVSFFNTSAPAVSRKLNYLQANNDIIKIRGKESDQRQLKLQVTDCGKQKYICIVNNINDCNLNVNSGMIDKLTDIVQSF